MSKLDDIGDELPSSEELSNISILVSEAEKVEDELAELAAKMSELSAKQKKLLEVDIPQAMLEAGNGITEFKMGNGDKVKVIPFVNASIKAEYRDEAFKWMRDNGYGDLIKREVKATFGMGEDGEAERAYNMLGEEGWIVDDKESVHAGTLKSNVKKWDEKGIAFPEELFGVYRGMTTKIDRAK